VVDCGRFQWLLPEIVLTVTSFFDHKRNEDILEKLKIEPVEEKLRRYKSNRLRHVTRMNNYRMPKIILNYSPNGWRRLRRPLKRLLDEAETGLSKPSPWRMMMMMMMLTLSLLIAGQLRYGDVHMFMSTRIFILCRYWFVGRPRVGKFTFKLFCHFSIAFKVSLLPYAEFRCWECLELNPLHPPHHKPSWP